MNPITTEYLSRAEIWLLITILAYFLMNGAQIFETAVIVPKWTASAPKSFTVFKGRYGLDFKPFWIAIHSLHEITFIAAIVLCWEIVPVRYWLLLLFMIHFAVRVWTIVYFAPNIIEFQQIAQESCSGPELAARTVLWRRLNYLRVAVFIVISIALLPLYFQVQHMVLNHLR